MPDSILRGDPPEGSEHGSFDAACQFVKELAKATQRYGVSSHQMTEYLARVSRAVDLSGEFVATPNHVVIVLWRGDESRQRVYSFGARSGNFNLARLARVKNLVNEVEAGSISPGKALERLQEIGRSRAEYGAVLNALAFVLCGAGFAGILRASWLDVLFGGLLGLASYGVTTWARHSRNVALATEPLAAAISSILASIVALTVPGVNPLAVTVCAVVWFVPGFGLTIAPNELLLGNPLAGLTWFSNAAVAMFKLIGGAVLGFALIETHWQVPFPEPGARVALGWSWGFVPLLMIGLAILFQVRARDLGWVLLGGWVVWGGVLLGNPFGFWQGTFFGAAALNVFASLCQRRFRLPAPVVLLPGIMILVPGVATLRALQTAQTQGIAAGLQSIYQVIVLIAAILGGLVVGNAILPSERRVSKAPENPS